MSLLLHEQCVKKQDTLYKNVLVDSSYWHGQNLELLKHQTLFKLYCNSDSVALIHTWVNDGVFLIKSYSRVPSFPFRPLDLQVTLFDGQHGDALVVRRVELCQVLSLFLSKGRQLDVNTLA